MQDTFNAEIINKKVLVFSMIGTAVFTVIALTVGFLTHSQVILFDGVFNMVGLLLTYLSMTSLKFIKKKDTWNYPFGKATFEPFIAIVQYGIILYICFTNIVTAIQVITEGGHAVDISSGIMYGIFSVLFNVGVFLYLKYLARKNCTAIAEVEIAQWRFSCLLGFGILIGFTLSFLLNQTNFAIYTAFVDPILTILITLLFGYTAIFSLKNNIKELLQGKPHDELVEQLTQMLDAINEKYEIKKDVKRIGKVGGKLIVEVDYFIEEGSKLDSIAAQDYLRHQVSVALKELPFEKWLNITFTGDITWAEHTIA